ncbi:MAG: heavy metal-responsive transcriptional regulator [Anaerolineae bacterium]
MSEQLLIGQLARAVGVNPKTIRYYEEIGVLPQPARTESGYRLYGPEDVERLEFVLRARSLGFSLDEVREILAFRERGEAPCLYVLDRIDRRIAEVEARISALMQLREELTTIRRDAEGLPVDDVEGKECVCHLIQNRALLTQQRRRKRGERR